MEALLAFIILLNGYRTDNGLQPLAVSPQLSVMADWMAADLAVGANFSHTDSLGRGPRERAEAFGVPCCVGENIAAGYASAADVFAAWRASPGHNENMLSTHYRTAALAMVYEPGSMYGWYWVLDFGTAPPVYSLKIIGIAK